MNYCYLNHLLTPINLNATKEKNINHSTDKHGLHSRFSHTNENTEEQHEQTTSGEAEDDAQGTVQSTSEERKEHKFHEPWLKKYLWLVYEKNGNFMYCNICNYNV